MPPKNQQQAGSSQEISIETSAKILELEQAVKQDPKNSEAWITLGNLFFDSNQPKNAIESYENALQLKPGKENPSVITDLGVIYWRNGQPEKAVETFEKAIEIDPSFEVALFNKGIVLMHDRDNLEGAIKSWEELVSRNPVALSPNGESVDALGSEDEKNRQP
jgi:tetratricopeptide (TPR) repeat protein